MRTWKITFRWRSNVYTRFHVARDTEGAMNRFLFALGFDPEDERGEVLDVREV